MTAKVDADKCTGCGLCADTCAEVFEMDGDVAKVKVAQVPAASIDACKEAAESCPVEAIALQD